MLLLDKMYVCLYNVCTYPMSTISTRLTLRHWNASYHKYILLHVFLRGIGEIKVQLINTQTMVHAQSSTANKDRHRSTSSMATAMGGYHATLRRPRVISTVIAIYTVPVLSRGPTSPAWLATWYSAWEKGR